MSEEEEEACLGGDYESAQPEAGAPNRLQGAIIDQGNVSLVGHGPGTLRTLL